MTTRSPAVAGTFYPADPNELREDLRHYLAAAEPTGARPKALIVPHAGYVYSGLVAARAYAELASLREVVRRVILLGPCHWVAVRGLALPESRQFRTPLGDIPLDLELIDRIVGFPQVQRFDSTHEKEHSLEVQLPFLQETLERFTLVPLVVGDATTDEVAEVLERLWGGEETLIIVSSDLSHYHLYAEARAMDLETCHAVEQMEHSAIGHEQACGRVPMAGLLAVARDHGMRIQTLELCNSGDTEGEPGRVVGYGAWLLEQAD